LKSIVIFGAGKIGRSFIGQVFSKAGYQLVFADIDKFLVNELNYQKHYNVIVKGEKEEVIPVFNARAIHLSDEETLLNELDNTSIAAVSVGQKGLPGVVKILAQSLERRQHRKPGSPLDLIIAENMRDSDEYIREELKKILPSDFPLIKSIGLIETSIGKMVPVISSDQINHDSLVVYAEPYNTLILSKKNFLNPIPAIPELAPKDNIKAWVDRKLFIHNFGHASLAYLATLKNPDFLYTWEALADKEIYEEVFQTMKESAVILHSMYSEEFSIKDLEIHILDLLKRFANKALGDTIYRVGCDLPRKLNPEDRIVPLIRIANNKNLPYKRIMKVLLAGILFPAKDAKGKMIEADRRFINHFNRNTEKIMSEHCMLDISKEKNIYKEAAKMISTLDKKYFQ
jgi:mannitol-1-phosphate 5-dehydrogenase